tara:strand:+ start:41 stop:301 length:261 start_codon:yes stop_codon:yes gene_type:complete
MNRKFIKENKSVLKEFIASVLGAILAKRGVSKLDKFIDSQPELKRKRQEIEKLGKDLKARIEKVKKTNPELAKRLADDPILGKYYR